MLKGVYFSNAKKLKLMFRNHSRRIVFDVEQGRVERIVDVWTSANVTHIMQLKKYNNKNASPNGCHVVRVRPLFCTRCTCPVM